MEKIKLFNENKNKKLNKELTKELTTLIKTNEEKYKIKDKSIEFDEFSVTSEWKNK